MTRTTLSVAQVLIMRYVKENPECRIDPIIRFVRQQLQKEYTYAEILQQRDRLVIRGLLDKKLSTSADIYLHSITSRGRDVWDHVAN